MINLVSTKNNPASINSNLFINEFQKLFWNKNAFKLILEIYWKGFYYKNVLEMSIV